MAHKANSLESAVTSVKPLDGQHETDKQAEQMLFMTRIPKAALASILSSWIYFLYAFKCLLDAQSTGLSGTALKVAWSSFAIQLGYSGETSFNSVFIRETI